MSERAGAALDLRNAIIEQDPAMWDRAMPDELVCPHHALLTIDEPLINPDVLHPDTLKRLLVTPENQDGNYELFVGRHFDPNGWTKRGGEQFIDYGPEAALVRASRVHWDGGVRITAWYVIDVAESHEPGQSPLCDMHVQMEDGSDHIELMNMLHGNGGDITNIWEAMGIDPLVSPDDQAPDTMDDVEFMQNLHKSVTGEELTAEQTAEFATQQAAKKGMREIESELRLDIPTTEEIVALTGLVRRATLGTC